MFALTTVKRDGSASVTSLATHAGGVGESGGATIGAASLNRALMAAANYNCCDSLRQAAPAIRRWTGARAPHASIA